MAPAFAAPNPSLAWYPRSDTGAGNGVGQALAFLNNGQMPKVTSNTTLKSVDVIQQQFSCPPWLDGAEKYMMPEMLCFATNEPTLDGSATVINTLPHANQLMYDAHVDFERMVADGEEPAVTFKRLLEKHGEVGLELYHQARSMNETGRSTKFWQDVFSSSELRQLYALSTQDMYCYLTRFGILSKLSYLGAIINLNRATNNEQMDRTEYTEHYTVVNVCMALRARVGNVFGSAEHVTTGTKLWLKLTRKRGQDGTFREYCIVPGGTKYLAKPLQLHDLAYFDRSGRAMTAHVWPVGVVNYPGPNPPSPSVGSEAANTGNVVNEQKAYNAHALVPTIWVSLGVQS